MIIDVRKQKDDKVTEIVFSECHSLELRRRERSATIIERQTGSYIFEVHLDGINHLIDALKLAAQELEK